MKVFATVILICFLTSSLYAASNHYFFTGVVNGIADNTITVSGRAFQFAPKVEVFSQERGKGGNFNEVKSRIGNVSSGTPVILRIEGAMVNRIVIEEWKK